MENLKSYRKKEIPMLILGNLLILIYLSGMFDVSMINKQNREWINLILTILNSTTLSSALYVFTLVLDGVFSDKLKYKLIYLFLWKMPGEIVFSEIKKNNRDIRINYKDLEKSHPEIYNNMPAEDKLRYKYENNEWYKMLNKHKQEDMVFQSHYDALMFRDMYCSNILLLILYFVFSIGLRAISFNMKYVIFSLVLSVALNIATRNKTKRFVYNVIASELSK